MASLYTDVLYVVQGLVQGTSVDVPCPVGKRMVVTNIDAASGAAAFAPLMGVEDMVTNATWWVAAVNGVLLTSAQWQGRQAFNYGGGFRLNAHLEDWDVRVTGWLLDLP